MTEQQRDIAGSFVRIPTLGAPAGDPGWLIDAVPGAREAHTALEAAEAKAAAQRRGLHAEWRALTDAYLGLVKSQRDGDGNVQWVARPGRSQSDVDAAKAAADTAKIAVTREDPAVTAARATYRSLIDGVGREERGALALAAARETHETLVSAWRTTLKALGDRNTAYNAIPVTVRAGDPSVGPEQAIQASGVVRIDLSHIVRQLDEHVAEFPAEHLARAAAAQGATA
ncbi:hypothetical protein [Curtobacterium sp. MCPF17_031]|uniref:hypothetical protein n=1 Tax=Curtobacterium sp. MCPF17_031 TaxID=2175653 RepID=UPI000DAA6634|nr:hypothetical protein [Curtobacterium sp. MCPF17_031]PZE34985.1 hypothetical protein DEJ31_12990 [Curtobacterium sp. MCPF17_031]